MSKKKPVEKPAKAESHTYNWRQRAGLLRGPAPKKAAKEKNSEVLSKALGDHLGYTIFLGTQKAAKEKNC